MGKNGEVLITKTGLFAQEETGEFEFTYKQLQLEIEQLKKSEKGLQKEKEILEDTAKLKDKFIALVSHDVRSPLTTIIGLLTMIQQNICTTKTTRCRELITRALFSCQNLCDMVEELLNYSRLQTGAIKPRTCFFNANAVITEAIDAFSYLSDKKKIAMFNKIPTAHTIHADRMLFSEVVRNLISNAIKFSNNDSAIEIYLPKQPTSTIAFRDYGTGMNKKTIKNLFRHEEKTTSKGTAGEIGTGLGMPYSHDIMEAHNGKLTVESSSDEGTLFYLSLPEIKPVFLIVDDQELDRIVLIEQLEEFNAEILEAENGSSAFKLLKNGTVPHLIFSDLQMPIMDGFEFLEEIAKIQSIRNIPSIMLTNDKSQGMREKLFNLGADDFINKPFLKEDLVPRVKKLLTLNCMRH